ncbi:MAG TPA: KamA family radical SAM protein [Xanthomonadales bacterium]|nr:KamA family radical SAM protein [Xanthomonadales bacterium]
MQQKLNVSISPGDAPGPTGEFRKTHYPDTSDAQWNDWRWQMRNRLSSTADLSQKFELTIAEKEALAFPGRPFPVSITPYYASLIDNRPDDPLRKTMIPVGNEFVRGPGEYSDPLGEDPNSPVAGLVHRYPDRVLFLMTDHCPVYCRYCTRSRLVGGNADWAMTKASWQKAIDYIAARPNIHDVLISGGDPLIYGDQKLEWLLGHLSAITHIDFIRIGTKVPMVLPQRITPELCKMLAQFHPLYFSIHVTHENELTAESRQACELLSDSGIPLGSQTVLLKGVNDNADALKSMFRRLLRMRVKPYYLLQCDPIEGSAHFRTPIKKGIEIMRALRGRLSGYGIPRFIVDLPEGGGKIALEPDYLEKIENDDWIFLSDRDSKHYKYHDPGTSL